MPAVSSKQQRFMSMCKHNPKHAYGKCPSMKVASEFSHKPKGGYRKKRVVPRKDSRGFY